MKMDPCVHEITLSTAKEVQGILPFHVTFFVVRLHLSILLLEYDAWLSKEVFVEQKKLTTAEFGRQDFHQMTLN